MLLSQLVRLNFFLVYLNLSEIKLILILHGFKDTVNRVGRRFSYLANVSLEKHVQYDWLFGQIIFDHICFRIGYLEEA